MLFIKNSNKFLLKIFKILQIKAYYESDFSIFSEEIRLLVYNKYSFISPLFKSSYNQKNKNEVILTFGSSCIWSFQGGFFL